MASTPRRPSALEHGSDRHETWPKRVSDDPRQFNFRRKKKTSASFFGLGNRFSPFWAGFEASSEKRTSKSTSWQFVAVDGPILSSVRPRIDKNMSVGALRSVMRRRPPHLSPYPTNALGVLYVVYKMYFASITYVVHTLPITYINNIYRPRKRLIGSLYI